MFTLVFIVFSLVKIIILCINSYSSHEEIIRLLSSRLWEYMIMFLHSVYLQVSSCHPKWWRMTWSAPLLALSLSFVNKLFPDFLLMQDVETFRMMTKIGQGTYHSNRNGYMSHRSYIKYGNIRMTTNLASDSIETL